MPASVCASTRKASLIGAEQNHLCPVSRKVSPSSGPPAVGTARVVFARTSDPPCFSVIPMPTSSPALSAGGRRAGS